MKNIIFTTLVLLLAACSESGQKITIKNVSESQTVILEKNKKGNVYALNISGSGNVKGEAQIMLMEGEKPYKIENISGKFNFKWGGDWYSDNATILYKTSNVTEGNVVIEYEFETL